MTVDKAEWRKSSKSNREGQCVEVATNLDAVAGIRDSKAPNEGHLEITRDQFRSFLSAVKSDRF